MPRCSASAGICSSLFVAPRALNDPVACRHSSFRERSAGVGGTASAVASNSGVRRTCGAMRACAALMSSSVIISGAPVGLPDAYISTGVP